MFAVVEIMGRRTRAGLISDATLGGELRPAPATIKQRQEHPMSEARWLVGDVFERMAELPDGSVDLIVTSPPFLALRSYLPADHPNKHLEIGSEATPAAFLSTLLALTREWRRVLAPHGSIAVELGDTYSGSGGAGGDYGPGGLRDGQQRFDGSASKAYGTGAAPPERKRTRHPEDNGRRNRPADVAAGILPSQSRPGPGDRDSIAGWPLAKSLCLLPTLYPASLAYGRNLLDPDDTIEPWRIRNLIVWHRPNPPVGALGDKVRPSTSYITTACVSDKRWFDLDAERRPALDERPRGTNGPKSKGKPAPSTNFGEDSGFDVRIPSNPAGAPLLDCWNIPTQPYNGSHYATFPQELPRRLINLMCPREVCTTCGEPRRRIVDVEHVANRSTNGPQSIDRKHLTGGSAGYAVRADRQVETLGWTDCGHNTRRRGHVLDPFAGSGTTLAVATGLGRDATGIDIDERNLDLARHRIGMFLTEQETPA